MNVTNSRAEKVDEKMGSFVQFPCSLSELFLSYVAFLKLSKKVHFLQFCADLNNKFKSVEAIQIYASERSRSALSENGVVCYAMSYYFRDITV